MQRLPSVSASAVPGTLALRALCTLAGTPLLSSSAPSSAKFNIMDTLMALCKKHGFIYQGSEAYGGLSGCFDYGPAGVELKRNISNEWWRTNVTKSRGKIHGLDSAIMMPYKVWKASGHVDLFKDKIGVCQLSGKSFRADKAPKLEFTTSKASGAKQLVVTAPNQKEAQRWLAVITESLAPGASVALSNNRLVFDVVEVAQPPPDPASDTPGLIKFASTDPQQPFVSIPFRGYGVAQSNSPFVSERLFNGMFRTAAGAKDPISLAIKTTLQRVASATSGAAPLSSANQDELTDQVDDEVSVSSVYLRPETAQSIFVQSQNIRVSTHSVLPFGVAQIGKAFRNEIDTEHFIFRSREFEQMEIEFFCAPAQDMHWHEHWVSRRVQWWQSLLTNPSSIRARAIPKDDLAHYAKACVDIEFAFPWGWGELEGIAARGNHDLSCHQQHSGANFHCPLPHDPSAPKDADATVLPHVVEPSAGLTRAVLAILLDALKRVLPGDPRFKDGMKTDNPRLVLDLHPRLAPFKAAVLPVVASPALVASSTALFDRLSEAFNAPFLYDEKSSIGKRYIRQDELGTPLCFVYDDQGLTVRYRDTWRQDRLASADEAVALVGELLAAPLECDKQPLL